MPSRLDLQPLWQPHPPRPGAPSALENPWGAQHRPDWAARGLIIWPRGGGEQRLQLLLERPEAWQDLQGLATARLCLRWWADAAELRVDGQSVHRGDLFDTACRWALPARWWRGEPLLLELRLVSPRHDDGALIHSHLELEPLDPGDPHGLLAPVVSELQKLRSDRKLPAEAPRTTVQVLGHAHLDLAWLWPVADTWAAAERTFDSVLTLMERWPELRFGHSTPALYAWLEQHRPALFERIRAAMRRGRWEPLNGPWVESDCQLIETPSLLRQFQLGQHYSRRAFPEWSHDLAWLPDSFGFASGLPAIAHATGVRWFCTHKLAWNATNPFPHRLFRWRSRCGAELLALMTAPIGTDGDPVTIETQRLEWQRVSGVEELLWLPGVGDHGGGPTAEMLEQISLWQQQPAMTPLRHGSLRGHLERLEPLTPRLPVWRDELYLELHRGCATSRPDQKRHNRSLERLLREAELARALLWAAHRRPLPPPGGDRDAARPAPPAGGKPGPGEGEQGRRQRALTTPVDWRTLLFQQFHDILPGTSIPEVFEQAEPEWRAARRQARRQRDLALLQALGSPALPRAAEGPSIAEPWWVAQLQPQAACHRCRRLPAGDWQLASGPLAGRWLRGQPAREGGVWLQLPLDAGVTALALRRNASQTADGSEPLAIAQPVQLECHEQHGWQLGNGLVSARGGSDGLEQLWDADGKPLLGAPLRWCRWRDQGEFWDAWDIAADHRDHPLAWTWQAGPDVQAAGPLCAELSWRGSCGNSPVRLTLRLLAGSPALELLLSVQWRQRHELLQLEIPLAEPQPRWAADTTGGVIERPAQPRTPREMARWELTALSWIAAPQLAVLLDGPQGVSAGRERLTVSLLRAPTWPDPGADNGWQRQRLALLPAPGGWREAGVPQQARRLREPLWLHPARGDAGCPDGAPPGGPEAPATASTSPAWPGFPPLPDDVRLLALRRARPQSISAGECGEAQAPGTAAVSTGLILTVQNEGPCRRRLQLPRPWRVTARLDGLDRPLAAGGDADPLAIAPWQIASWQLQLDPAATTDTAPAAGA